MGIPPLPESDGVALWPIIFAGAQFFLNLLLAFGAAIWAIRSSKSATDDKIADKDKALTVELIAMERRLQEDIADSSHNFGETVQAFRQKLTDTELWNRDNFVNKNTFNTVITEIRRGWEQFEKRLDQRLDRLEDKIDGKTAPRHD